MTVRTPTPTTSTTTTTHETRPQRERTDLERIGRINRRLAAFLATALVGIAVAVTLLLLQGGAPTVSRADAAWTARLDEAAAQYEAIRQTRSNDAWTARLDAAAEQHEALLRARALEADAARLTAQAEARAGR